MILENIAIGFVLFMVFCISYRVAKTVPDEVEPSRKYVSFGIDALLIISVGLYFAFKGSILLAVIASAVLILCRLKWNLHSPYPVITGVILALAISFENYFGLIMIIMAANYLYGMQSNKLPESLAKWTIQPIAFILTALAI